MKFFFILFILTNKLHASEVSCVSSEQRVANLSYWIASHVNSQDVSNNVDIVERLITECNLDINKFGRGKGLFDFWRRTGYESTLNNAKAKIEHYSQYREVKAVDVEKYKTYAQKLGYQSKDIEQYLHLYTEQGKVSNLREKNKCQPKIDLRNETLGAVRDQDSIGWCYAFAAADLLTYKLKKKISAADVAMNYNDTLINRIFKKLGGFGEQNFHGGDEGDAIEKTAKKGGACLEKNLRSEDNGYSTLMTTLTDIEKIKENSTSDISSLCSKAAMAMFPNMTLTDYLAIAKGALKTDLLERLSDKACGPRISLDRIRVKSQYAFLESGRKELFDQIDKQLANKNIVSIGYNSKALYDVDTQEEGLHASVAVGRRYNASNGECEYLIRNSWGRACSSYDQRLSCEEGNIWVPKSALVKGILNVTYLE